ncbi:MAG: flagellar biosynthesis anti-sigma factor FlgM [Bdellovibrionales bacterium]|nr:flagellar biosynthesis anti-sigma factor FlgM [Bdellovibrionales bacterium]
MKINNNVSNQLNNIDNAKTDKLTNSQNTKDSQNQNTVGDPTSAKVNLSEEAQRMGKAKELASKGLNEVDEDKVAHFQKLIDEGKYSVDANDIADKLVDTHLSTM